MRSADTAHQVDLLMHHDRRWWCCSCGWDTVAEPRNRNLSTSGLQAIRHVIAATRTEKESQLV